MKKCFVCELEKQIESFYKHPKMKDGRLNKCKECCKNQSVENYKKLMSTDEGIEKERKRSRDKYLKFGNRSVKCKETRKGYINNYREKYPEKYKAKALCQRIKPAAKGNHLHHWNYNIEFAKDVIELKIPDHAKAHRFMRYDKKTFMYKDLNGNLLDTKEKHQNYINLILDNF